MDFVKMHGLGNDFVILDFRPRSNNGGKEEKLRFPNEKEIRAICDRRCGVGCDQLILLEPADKAEVAVKMRIVNADGSEVGACGNATRCVARLLNLPRSLIQTQCDLLDCWLVGDDEVAVNMGPPRQSWLEIPLSRDIDPTHLELLPGLPPAVAVNFGNPHCVFIVPEDSPASITEVGAAIETHELFPQRTNVELVVVLNPKHLRVRVWERGVGVTAACGTGACASAFAAVLHGHCQRDTPILVEFDQGSLTITWNTPNNVVMVGPATRAFSGKLDPSLFDPHKLPA